MKNRKIKIHLRSVFKIVKYLDCVKRKSCYGIATASHVLFKDQSKSSAFRRKPFNLSHDCVTLSWTEHFFYSKERTGLYNVIRRFYFSKRRIQLNLHLINVQAPRGLVSVPSWKYVTPIGTYIQRGTCPTSYRQFLPYRLTNRCLASVLRLYHQ